MTPVGSSKQSGVDGQSGPPPLTRVGTNPHLMMTGSLPAPPPTKALLEYNRVAPILTSTASMLLQRQYTLLANMHTRDQMRNATLPPSGTNDGSGSSSSSVSSGLGSAVKRNKQEQTERDCLNADTRLIQHLTWMSRMVTDRLHGFMAHADWRRDFGEGTVLYSNGCVTGGYKGTSDDTVTKAINPTTVAREVITQTIIGAFEREQQDKHQHRQDTQSIQSLSQTNSPMNSMQLPPYTSSLPQTIYSTSGSIPSMYPFPAPSTPPPICQCGGANTPCVSPIGIISNVLSLPPTRPHILTLGMWARRRDGNSTSPSVATSSVHSSQSSESSESSSRVATQAFSTEILPLCDCTAASLTPSNSYCPTSGTFNSFFVLLFFANLDFVSQP